MNFGHAFWPYQCTLYISRFDEIHFQTLRKLVLVFFDDIIICNKSWKDHVQDVDRVLKLLEEKQLYTKTSKCFFGVQEVEYLGYVVSHDGVKVDPNKIKSIKEWKIPTTIKHLRGFLGLKGYY